MLTIGTRVSTSEDLVFWIRACEFNPQTRTIRYLLTSGEWFEEQELSLVPDRSSRTPSERLDFLLADDPFTLEATHKEYDQLTEYSKKIGMYERSTMESILRSHEHLRELNGRSRDEIQTERDSIYAKARSEAAKSVTDETIATRIENMSVRELMKLLDGRS